MTIGPPPEADQRKAFDDAVADGSLQGVTIEPVPELAVAGSDGVTFLTPAARPSRPCRSMAAARTASRS